MCKRPFLQIPCFCISFQRKTAWLNHRPHHHGSAALPSWSNALAGSLTGHLNGTIQRSSAGNVSEPVSVINSDAPSNLRLSRSRHQTSRIFFSSSTKCSLSTSYVKKIEKSLAHLSGRKEFKAFPDSTILLYTVFFIFHIGHGGSIPLYHQK